ncbi:DUF6567 family protein [Psychroflexus tropicus]|jgi:hypothetical protein|uniref:DUF6567 family protein n=1 Tax=Psychroflexus tropicus TaxID=197345 RepID=UPI00037A909A|nr:DUF6567 family protein [Psychroflexus tropicus]
MIKKFTIIAGLVSTVLLTSCAGHYGLTTNINNHTTEVVLADNNFKVISSVSGDASVTYILGIGGLSKKALIAEARKEMLEKANLEGSAKAIINETVEIKGTSFPFVGKKTVTVSAQVIEFLD